MPCQKASPADLAVEDGTIPCHCLGNIGAMLASSCARELSRFINDTTGLFSAPLLVLPKLLLHQVFMACWVTISQGITALNNTVERLSTIRP
jgi:hypothetical protein